MKIITLTTLLVAAACLPAIGAAEPIEVQWKDVCKVTTGKAINIETAAGENVRGYCLSISVDEMSVRKEDGKVVKLSRSALRLIRMHRAKTGQLRSLGRGMHETLRAGLGMLFSPSAPAAIVSLPGTIAWGVVAAPFCALSDLHDKLHGTREIKVM